ncbi:hypothetical protein MPL1032_80183 [Mesorhizobium plurifarium]|uniref:Uncharacterized protein n=1 Tax=Mesorhizobium plurifarium TaxID=69974 RepID=A0A0K2W786_MESPL|nr:hypothetical protein MPL1032_80183 [Mesorhizobium plurifarium]
MDSGGSMRKIAIIRIELLPWST